MAIDANGIIYVSEVGNDRIRIIIPDANANNNTSSVPTLNQWGMIILTLLILCLGAITLQNHRPTTKTT